MRTSLAEKCLHSFERGARGLTHCATFSGTTPAIPSSALLKPYCGAFAPDKLIKSLLVFLGLRTDSGLGGTGHHPVRNATIERNLFSRQPEPAEL